MPGAKRYFVPHCVWPITHHYHKKKNFFFNSPGIVDSGDSGYSRQKKCYGLCILNYMLTLNHIHLLADNTLRFRRHLGLKTPTASL